MHVASPLGPDPRADSVLAGLDPDQRAAVTAPPGVVVVRAGAGSGKTTVLTRRVAWRSLTGDADAQRTLAITFTRQAATELRTRLAPYDLDGRPTVGTFHAVARRLMVQRLSDLGRRIPVIVSNRTSVMSACMGDDAKRGGVAEVLAAVDWAHAAMLEPHTVESRARDTRRTLPLGPGRFAEVFEAYEQAKRKRGVVDLNDFITYVVRESERDPRFMESIRFQFRHVSVDEAQDMNPLQFAMVRAIAGESPDLFLVGDPNQAIYAFNGADRTLFDELPGITGGMQIVSLPSNHRCTPDIVDFAVASLAKDGQLADARSTRPPGAPVRLERCADEDAELDVIVRRVRAARSFNREWEDIAVLVRVNGLVDRVRGRLDASGIPVRTNLQGGEWGRAVAAATALTGRESLSTWSSDILDSGDYSSDDVEYVVASHVRAFLDANRSGTVDGRTFGSWLATAADVTEARGVDVLTFHAAKGREWSFVVVAAAEKGQLPHAAARGASARHEEARLGYVAFTRAADELVVTWTDMRNKRTTGPSPLLPWVSSAPARRTPPPADFVRRTPVAPVDPVAEGLAHWRRRRARAAKVAVEGIVTDRQFAALVRRRPTSAEEVAAITDPVFAGRFAEEILEVVRSATDR